MKSERVFYVYTLDYPTSDKYGVSSKIRDWEKAKHIALGDNEYGLWTIIITHKIGTREYAFVRDLADDFVPMIPVDMLRDKRVLDALEHDRLHGSYSVEYADTFFVEK